MTSKSMWTGSSVDAIAAGATNYFPAFGAQNLSATENDENMVVSVAGNAKNLVCKIGGALGGGETLTYTLRVNAGDSTLTCQIGSGAASCTDVTHTVTLAIGDIVDYKMVSVGVSTARGRCGLEYNAP